MGESTICRRCLCRAAVVLGLSGLLASCAEVGDGPAPVFMKGGGPGIVGEGGMRMPGRSAAGPAEARTITIERGQSLGRIAEAHHVPKRAIIAANHLTPPYKLKTGAHLLIPGAAPAPVQQAMITATAAPPISGSASALAEHASPDMIPLDEPPPQPALAPVRPAAGPAPSSAALSPPPAPPPTPAAAPVPAPPAARPVPAAAPTPAAPPPPISPL